MGEPWIKTCLTEPVELSEVKQIIALSRYHAGAARFGGAVCLILEQQINEAELHPERAAPIFAGIADVMINSLYATETACSIGNGWWAWGNAGGTLLGQDPGPDKTGGGD